MNIDLDRVWEKVIERIALAEREHSPLAQPDRASDF